MRRLIPLLVVTAALAAAAPAARADWTRPFGLSPTESDTFPSVGVDDADTAVFAWSHLNRTQLRVRDPDGTLRPVQTISPQDQLATANPIVVMNGAGVAAIAYKVGVGGDSRLALRVRDATGHLSAQQLVSHSGQNAGAFDLGIDDAGRVLVAWTTPSGIRAVVRETDGTLGNVASLSSATVVQALRVAVDGAGDGVVTWETNTPAILDRVRPAGGSFGPVHTESAPGAAEPDVGMDATGRIVTVWARDDEVNNRLLIEARARPLSGQAGGVKIVDQVPTTSDLFHPSVAVAPNGTAAIAYEAAEAAPVVRGAVLKPSQSPTAPIDLSRTDQGVERPAIAIDDAGDAQVMWAVFAGLDSRITARPLLHDGTPGSITTVSELDPAMTRPAIALNGAGAGAADWLGADDTGPRVQGAALTLP